MHTHKRSFSRHERWRVSHEYKIIDIYQRDTEMRLCGGLVGSTAANRHSQEQWRSLHCFTSVTTAHNVTMVHRAQAVPLHLGVSHLETYLWPNPHDLGNLLPWSSKEIPNTPSRYKINTSKQLTVHQLGEGGLTVCLTQCDRTRLPTGSSIASPSVPSAATGQASFSHHLMRSPTKQASFKE